MTTRKPRKYVFLWFSFGDRKFIRPQVQVEIDKNQMRGTTHTMNETRPSWTGKFHVRRGLAVALSLVLIAIWAVCISNLQLGWVHYTAMGSLAILFLGVLNFSFRSIFDLPDETLDERLYSLRNTYSFRSYQAIGVIALFTFIVLSFSNLDPSRLWLPFLATYASIPYLFMGWSEKKFS